MRLAYEVCFSFLYPTRDILRSIGSSWDLQQLHCLAVAVSVFCHWMDYPSVIQFPLVPSCVYVRRLHWLLLVRNTQHWWYGRCLLWSIPLTHFNLQHTTIEANVVDVKTGTELTTNEFKFTWCDDNGEPLARRVVPRTYQGGSYLMILLTIFLSHSTYVDAMEWIEAKRAVDTGHEIRKLRAKYN